MQHSSCTGAEGTGGAGGRKRAWLRCPWTVAEPGRQHTNDKPRPIGGRRGACGAWPGFEIGRAEPPNSDQAPLV